jgi:hypothetical protein
MLLLVEFEEESVWPKVLFKAALTSWLLWVFCEMSKPKVNIHHWQG